MSAKTLSVVIPCFNDVANLKLCLAALKSSVGAAPAEILVVDDASDILLKEEISDFGVKVFRNSENRGQSFSRNFGASQATGDFILFLDSDAIVSSTALEQVHHFISSASNSGLIGMQGLFSLDAPYRDWPSLIYNTIQHLANHPHRFNLSLNTSFVVLRNEAFQRIGPFSESQRYLEDVEFSRRMRALGFYLQNGPAVFHHRKRASWSWLFRGWMLGGSALRTMRRSKPEAIPGIQENHVLRNWMASGAAGILGISLLLLGQGWNVLFGMLLLVPFAWTGFQLGKVFWGIKRSFTFSVTGTVLCFSVPLFVLIGAFTGHRSSNVGWWLDSRRLNCNRE